MSPSVIVKPVMTCLPVRPHLHPAITPQAKAEALQARQGRLRPEINGQNADRRAVTVLAAMINAPEGDALDGAEGVEVVKGRG